MMRRAGSYSLLDDVSVVLNSVDPPPPITLFFFYYFLYLMHACCTVCTCIMMRCGVPAVTPMINEVSVVLSFVRNPPPPSFRTCCVLRSVRDLLLTAVAPRRSVGCPLRREAPPPRLHGPLESPRRRRRSGGDEKGREGAGQRQADGRWRRRQRCSEGQAHGGTREDEDGSGGGARRVGESFFVFFLFLFLFLFWIIFLFFYFPISFGFFFLIKFFCRLLV